MWGGEGRRGEVDLGESMLLLLQDLGWGEAGDGGSEPRPKLTEDSGRGRTR